MKQFSKILGVMLLVATVALMQADCGSSGCNTSCNNSCDNSCNDSCNNSCNNSCNTSGCFSCNNCHSIFLPRDQGANLAYFGFAPYTHKFDMDCFYGGWDIGFEYKQSFKNHRIAECLFGNDTLTFLGTDALISGTRPTCALIADNFGISPFANGSIEFRPRIRNELINFNFYLGFDEWWSGFWIKAWAPLVFAQWNLRGECTNTPCGTNNCCNFSDSSCNNSCDSSCNNSCGSSNCNVGCSNTCSLSNTCTLVTTPFPAGCVAPVSAGAITPASSIQQALSGDFTFGNMTTPWNFGRFRFCDQKKVALADIWVQFGYNFWNCEDYHVGAFFQFVAPTGTKLDQKWARNVFSPIIGNGKHWEVGGGLSAHAEIWSCEDQSWTVYLEGYANHLFKNCQVRSFDFLGNGCLSRYELLAEYTLTGTTYTANGNLINAINFNTRRAESRISVKGEAIIKFVYRNCGWSAGIGYDFFGQDHEKLCIKSGALCDPSLDSRFFGIRGCTPVQGLLYTTTLIGGAGAPVFATATPTAVNVTASESNATATACGTVDHAVSTLVSPVTGVAGSVVLDPCVPFTVTSLVTTVASATATPNLIVSNSVPPVLVSVDSLDPRSGAAARQIIHKLFGTLDYSWLECDYTPFVGIGVEADFASCKNTCSLNQWGVWIKGGMAF